MAGLPSLAHLVGHGYGHLTGEIADLPPPPYHLDDANFFAIGGRLPPSAIAALLPPSLEAVDGGYGALMAYEVGRGWGIAPYTGFMAFIEIKGYSSPDGSNARFVVRGYYSDKATPFMMGLHGSMRPGRSRVVLADNEVSGFSGPPGDETVQLHARLTGLVYPPTYGSNKYLLLHPENGTRVAPVTFNSRHYEAVEPRISLGPDAEACLLPFASMEIGWAAYTPGTTFTIGEPKPVDPVSAAAEEQARVALLSVFGQIGRAAAIVSADGTSVRLNDNARACLGDGLLEAHGKLRAWRPSDQAKIERVIKAATGDGGARLSAEVVAIARPDGGRPLLVQALPILRTIGEQVAILLITDPDEPVSGDATQSLLLMGLTPAEARTAMLVGQGVSTRDAAAQLGNTEGTVRVTLKQIYDKLGVARAAELASLLGRLRAFAPLPAAPARPAATAAPG